MADEIRVTEGGRAPGVAPEDPEATRAEIEITRQRMSETIDDIEDVLVRKKNRVQERLDVLAPVRERPLASAGVALGAGLALGLLTGGESEDGWSGGDRRRLADAEARAERWESRARRLLEIANEQEDEIERLSVRRGERDERHASSPGGLESLRDRVMDSVGGYVSLAVREALSAMRHRG